MTRAISIRFHTSPLGIFSIRISSRGYLPFTILFVLFRTPPKRGKGRGGSTLILISQINCCIQCSAKFQNLLHIKGKGPFMVSFTHISYDSFPRIPIGHISRSGSLEILNPDFGKSCSIQRAHLWNIHFRSPSSNTKKNVILGKSLLWPFCGAK